MNNTNINNNYTTFQNQINNFNLYPNNNNNNNIEFYNFQNN